MFFLWFINSYCWNCIFQTRYWRKVHHILSPWKWKISKKSAGSHHGGKWVFPSYICIVIELCSLRRWKRTLRVTRKYTANSPQILNGDISFANFCSLMEWGVKVHDCILLGIFSSHHVWESLSERCRRLYTSFLPSYSKNIPREKNLNYEVANSASCQNNANIT